MKISIQGVEFETTGKVKYAKDEYAKGYLEAISTNMKYDLAKQLKDAGFDQKYPRRYDNGEIINQMYCVT